MSKRRSRYTLNPELLTESVMARFDAKVDDSGECHVWTGARSTNGYGHMWLSPLGTTIKAHRISFTAATGEVLDPALDLDHLCRNRACVNPNHLEPVTRAENLARGEGPNADTLRARLDRGMCSRGHDLTKPDAWRPIHGGRSRVCRLCSNEWARNNRKKAAA